jgi:hypothetical protein
MAPPPPHILVIGTDDPAILTEYQRALLAVTPGALVVSLPRLDAIMREREVLEARVEALQTELDVEKQRHGRIVSLKRMGGQR